MRYLTTTVDFYYDGLDWRIQLWKGQYGPFGGGEVGVYTKDPETNDKLYNCADNDHLLNMYYDLYMTPNTYAVKDRFFYRDAWTGGGHWWLTGFKMGSVNPNEMVMSLKIRMRSRKMANAFEEVFRLRASIGATLPRITILITATIRSFTYSGIIPAIVIIDNRLNTGYLSFGVA